MTFSYCNLNLLWRRFRSYFSLYYSTKCRFWIFSKLQLQTFQGWISWIRHSPEVNGFSFTYDLYISWSSLSRAPFLNKLSMSSKNNPARLMTLLSLGKLSMEAVSSRYRSELLCQSTSPSDTEMERSSSLSLELFTTVAETEGDLVAAGEDFLPKKKAAREERTVLTSSWLRGPRSRITKGLKLTDSR